LRFFLKQTNEGAIDAHAFLEEQERRLDAVRDGLGRATRNVFLAAVPSSTRARATTAAEAACVAL
jgi:hypothetical protein